MMKAVGSVYVTAPGRSLSDTRYEVAFHVVRLP